MKDFIKAHPYLGCAGLALATNSAAGLCNVMHKENSSEFLVVFQISAILGTLPAILTATIDKYVHQNITENVSIQHGLIAAESLLSIPSIVSRMHRQNKFNEYFKNLFSLDFSSEDIPIKVLTASILIQSLGFKYILDSANEEIEIENDQSLFGEDNLRDGFEAEICM